MEEVIFLASRLKSLQYSLISEEAFSQIKILFAPSAGQHAD